MGTILETGDFSLPDNTLDPWLGKIQKGSSVSVLSGSIPMKFGTGQAMVFDIGEAEYVGEGAQKGASTFTKTTQSTAPFKFHKTIRRTEEVMYADEDYQLGVVQNILDEVAPALARALDYGIFHGIDPLSGDAVAAMTQKLSDAGNTVVYDSALKPYAVLDESDTAVLGKGFVPSDVALDPSLAAMFSTIRGKNSEQKLYPNFLLNASVSELDGHRASVNRTVGARGVATVDSDILGFVGDFSAIRWGIQRQMGLELIEYGDPDGQGDLKRNNQVAFRMEVIYGWGIADLDAFAVITGDTSASSASA